MMASSFAVDLSRLSPVQNTTKGERCQTFVRAEGRGRKKTNKTRTSFLEKPRKESNEYRTNCEAFLCVFDPKARAEWNNRYSAIEISKSRIFVVIFMDSFRMQTRKK
jgi:hypothetical protein